MSKNIKYIIIMGIALVIMFTANIILNSAAQNDIDAADKEYIYISNYSVDSVTKVEIENEHGLLTLINEDGTWNAQEHEDVELDQEIVSEIIYILTHIVAEREVSDNEDSDNLYGMLNPNGRITTYHEGVLEQTFLIGDKAPLENQYYMQSSVFKKVYTADMAYYIYSQIKLEDLMVLKGVEVAHADMRKIRVVNSLGEEFTIQRTAHNNDISLCYWEFIEPFNHDADTGVLYGTEKYDGMITHITELIADSVIKFGDIDVQSYGIDNPLFTAEIYNDAGLAQNFRIGDFEDENDYALMFDNSNVVYSVAKDRVPFIDYSVFMISDGYLNLINLDAVSRVNIDLPELTAEINVNYDQIKNDDGTNAVDADGNVIYGIEIDITDVQKDKNAATNLQEQIIWFYEDIAAIKIDDMVYEYELGDKIGSIYFELNSEYRDSYLVDFYKYNLSHYLVKKNNEDMGYLVNKKEINNLLKSYAKLKEGRLKQSD